MNWLNTFKRFISFSDKTFTHKRMNTDSESAYPDVKKFGAVSYSVVYEKMYKYCKEKNSKFKFAMNVAILRNKQHFTKAYMVKEIRRLSACINDPTFPQEDKERFENIRKFYNDVLITHKYFLSIGAKITTDDIINILKEIQWCEVNSHIV